MCLLEVVGVRKRRRSARGKDGGFIVVWFAMGLPVPVNLSALYFIGSRNEINVQMQLK